jgi:hypothetical protein
MSVTFPKVTKKRAAITSGLLLASFIVFTVAVWAINNSYVQFLKKDLKTTKTSVKKETSSFMDSLNKYDPIKPEDQKQAVAALEKYKKTLKRQLRPAAEKIRPFLIKSNEFQQAEDAFTTYENSLYQTINSLDALIVSVTYQIRLNDAFAPVFGNAASANAVDPPKQAAAWHQALDDVKKLSPDGAAKAQHSALQFAIQEIISATNEVAAAQSKNDPDAYNVAMEKLQKSYESVNTSAEALQAILRDKQTKLAKVSKSLF